MSFERQSLLPTERFGEGAADWSSENVAIRVAGVSKCYHLYEKPQDRLRQSLYPRLQRMFGRTIKNYAREFWALRDISFEVKKGETVGIIGRNGAGKSTLLQIIAGTLEPTQGVVNVHGRVAALLELGSGFNPEFTGRENVYVNAAIQGLSQAETDAKFDDIAAFADIGDFIEQPIKTYSSGMMVRLAFAVQVAVEPDILIIDEALAVGDMRFSMKCIRRMRQLVDRGTACLFVSHDMSSIVNFCRKALWLQDGRVFEAGDPKTVTINYANFMTYGFLPHQGVHGEQESHNEPPSTLAQVDLSGIEEQQRLESLSWVDLSDVASLGSGGARITEFALCKNGTAVSIFSGGEDAELFLRITSTEHVRSPIVCADFRDSKGNLIFGLNTYFINRNMPELLPNTSIVLKFEFRVPLLLKGDYGVSVAVADGDPQAHEQLHIINEAFVVHMIPMDLRQTYYLVANENCDCEVLFLSDGTP